MWLILADETDSSAQWMSQMLKRRGMADVQLVSASAVAYNLFWNYRMNSDRSDTEFVFGDGRKLRIDAITGVINRLQTVPIDTSRGPFVAGRHSEREQMAYFVSWMYGLPVPVINRPSTHTLSGKGRDAADWALLASIAGLRPAPFCRTAANITGRESIETKLVPFEMPTHTVYVIGNRVIGADVPVQVAERCIALAYMAKCEILGIEFVANTSHTWLVAGVTAFPDLRPGGEPLADALSQIVEQRSRIIRTAAC